jgi:hypothetical protein
VTDVRVDDFDTLVSEYAGQIRRNCAVDREFAYAHAFVHALTNSESRLSNARQLQRVRAVTAAADKVRAERQEG